MSLSKDERGVSEIVGALLLVVVVSSAVVGFGMFLSQQAKLTQEQKAAELERSLEVLEITSIDPDNVDFTSGSPCTEAVDGDPDWNDSDWNQLAFRVTSLHLHESKVSALRVNGLVVRHAVVDLDDDLVSGVTVTDGDDEVIGDFDASAVGREITGTGIPDGTTIVSFDEEAGTITMSANADLDGDGEVTLGDLRIDFRLLPGETGYTRWTIGPRATALVTLENVANDDHSVGCLGAYSFFGTAVSAITTTDSIQVELVTELANTVERAFIPPSAVLILDQRGSGATSYILDGSASETLNGNGFLVRWDWSIACVDPDAEPIAHDDDCDVGEGGPFEVSGRMAQASVIGNDDPGDSGTVYTITLTVTDNFGMKGSAEFVFTLP